MKLNCSVAFLARPPLVEEIRARLGALYGERASLEIVSQSRALATARLRIPMSAQGRPKRESAIVNINAVSGVARDFRGYLQVRLKARKETLAVSERFAHRFRQM